MSFSSSEQDATLLAPLSPPLNNQNAAYSLALLRSLKAGGVKFLRFTSVDACNNIRAKVKPIDYLLKQQRKSNKSVLEDQVAIAAVCFAGLPYYADQMIEGTGLTAENVLVVQPDLETLQVLPYAPQTASVMGYLTDQYTKNSSQLDSRALLARVVDYARDKHDIALSVGVELEFCLVNAKTGAFLDDSVYANAGILDDQQEFISEVYDQLEQQEIEVELIHAESGPVLMAQETIRAAAHKFNKKALFLPKYIASQAGNGLHLHLSIQKASTQQPFFAVKGQPATISPEGSAFVEGILEHLPGLLGLSAPSKNSHHRIGKGCWTGSKVGWALEDKESGIRVCSNLSTQEWDHFEYKLCDSRANLYLTLAGIFLAGLDGIDRCLTLRPALEPNSSADELPATVEEALDAFEENSLLTSMMGSSLSKAYLALRRHEAKTAASMSLEDEIRDALRRA